MTCGTGVMVTPYMGSGCPRTYPPCIIPTFFEEFNWGSWPAVQLEFGSSQELQGWTL